MKTITLLAALLLSACGGAPLDSQQPSARPAVPCEQSAECKARTAAGQAIATCAESYMGNPAVMMSTWDNGKTWLIGNCDSTAK
jgi:hypothetical protein